MGSSDWDITGSGWSIYSSGGNHAISLNTCYFLWNGRNDLVNVRISARRIDPTTGSYGQLALRIDPTWQNYYYCYGSSSYFFGNLRHFGGIRRVVGGVATTIVSRNNRPELIIPVFLTLTAVEEGGGTRLTAGDFLSVLDSDPSRPMIGAAGMHRARIFDDINIEEYA